MKKFSKIINQTINEPEVSKPAEMDAYKVIEMLFDKYIKVQWDAPIDRTMHSTGAPFKLSGKDDFIYNILYLLKNCKVNENFKYNKIIFEILESANVEIVAKKFADYSSKEKCEKIIETILELKQDNNNQDLLIIENIYNKKMKLFN